MDKKYEITRKKEIFDKMIDDGDILKLEKVERYCNSLIKGVIKRDINLKFDSTKDAAYTDGDNIVISPSFQLVKFYKGYSKLMCIIGLLAHELAHIKYLNFGEYKKYHRQLTQKWQWYGTVQPRNDKMAEKICALCEQSPSMHGFMLSIFGTFNNILDDVHDESCMFAEMPGSILSKALCYPRFALDKSRDYLDELILNERYSKIGLCAEMILNYARFGYNLLNEGAELKPAVKEYLELLENVKEDIELGCKTHNMLERFSCVNNILIEIFVFVYGDLEDFDQPKDEDNTGENGDSNQSESNEGSGQPKESGNSESNEGSGQPKKSSSAEDNEGSGQPKKSSSAEDNEGSGQPKESGSSEGSEDSDQSKGNGSSEGSEDSGQSKESGSSEGSEDSDQSKGNGSSEGSEDSGQSKESGSAEGSEDSDQSKENGNPKESNRAKNKKSSKGELDLNDMENQFNKAKEELEGISKKISPQKTPRLSKSQDVANPSGDIQTMDIKDMEDMMESAEGDFKNILEQAIKEAITKTYLSEEERKRLNELNSQNFDFGKIHAGVTHQITRDIDITKENIESYNKIYREIKTYSTSMQRKIKEVLKDRREGGKIHGQYFGNRFEQKSISRIDGCYFSKTKMPTESPTIAVGVLIDESGSMFTADRIEYAKKTAILLEDFARGLDIPLMIYGHTEIAGVVCLNSYSEFQKLDKNDRYRLTNITSRSSNRDGYAMKYMIESLKKRNEDVKLLFVISDGLPAGCGGYFGKPAIEDMKNVITEARRNKILVFAAAVGDDKENISQIYGDGFLNISDMSKMPKNFIQIIKKNMI